MEQQLVVCSSRLALAIAFSALVASKLVPFIELAWLEDAA